MAARKRLVRYLSSAEVVHVASFLGSAGPGGVLDLMRAVRDANADVKFSVDPGSVWAASSTRDPAVLEILRLATWVFANVPELRDLGGNDEIEAAATAMLERAGKDATMLLLKQWDQAVRYEWDKRSGRAVGVAVEQSVLADTQIIDSTGAGDVFAAGVIAGERSKRVQRPLAVRLGLAAGRHRLQHLGDAGYRRLGDVVTGQWTEITEVDVFVSHASADKPGLLSLPR